MARDATRVQRREPHDLAMVLPSIHYVLRAEALLKDAHLDCDLIPVPRQISSECGMAVTFPHALWPRVRPLLNEHGITVVGLYRRAGRTFTPYEEDP